MTCVELFAGAGGLALGLEQAGFEHLGLVEKDKVAAATLEKNRPQWNIYCADVSLYSNTESITALTQGREVDLLSGGVPCQSFSYAGKRGGLEDSRGTMIYQYVKLLRLIRPKMFLIENVRGLLTHDKGKTYTYIRKILQESGYTVQEQVLNACNYGVAQKRERLFVVGVRNDLTERVQYKFPEEQRKLITLREALKDVPESAGLSYSKTKQAVMSLVPEGGNWRDIDVGTAKAYMKRCWDAQGGKTGVLRRLSWDEPALTIMTSPIQKTTDRCHPTETRPLTVRECARIQSFPDEWVFTGTVTQQYKQVGNAVPVNLAQAVGVSIIQTLSAVL